MGKFPYTTTQVLYRNRKPYLILSLFFALSVTAHTVNAEEKETNQSTVRKKVGNKGIDTTSRPNYNNTPRRKINQKEIFNRIHKRGVDANSVTHPNQGTQIKRKYDYIKKKHIKLPPKHNTNSNPNYNYYPRPKYRRKSNKRKIRKVLHYEKIRNYNHQILNHGTRYHALRYGHNFPVRRKVFDFPELIKFGLMFVYQPKVWYVNWRKHLKLFGKDMKSYFKKLIKPEIYQLDYTGFSSNIFFEYRFQPKIFGIRTEFGVHYIHKMKVKKDTIKTNRALLLSPALYLRFYIGKSRNFCMYFGPEFSFPIIAQNVEIKKGKTIKEKGKTIQTPDEEVITDTDELNIFHVNLFFGMDGEFGKGVILGFKFCPYVIKGVINEETFKKVMVEKFIEELQDGKLPKIGKWSKEPANGGVIVGVYLGYNFAGLFHWN